MLTTSRPRSHALTRLAFAALLLLACDTPAKPIPMGRCAAEQDCTPAEGTCLAPGQFAGCGICRRPLPSEICTSDAACAASGPTSVCVNTPSLCLCSGETVCANGCTADSDCREGQTCAANHRCQPKACAAASDCPTDFRCDAAQCVRKPCTTSRDCTGYCVGTACYSTPGTCNLPRP